MNDRLGQPAARAPLRRKSVILPVAFQCLPLLFLGSIILAHSLPRSIETPFPLIFLPALLAQPGFLWGLGYAYLGRFKRFVLTFLLGLLITLVARGLPSAPFQGWGREILVGLVVGVGVLLLAVDAWRLAAAHNARVDEQERDDAEASGHEPVPAEGGNTMNDHLARPATRVPLKRKSVIVAIALQCLPLLFLGSIILASLGLRQTPWAPLVSLLALLGGFLWGLGYAYLVRAKRLAVTFVLGPLLVLGTLYWPLPYLLSSTPLSRGALLVMGTEYYGFALAALVVGVGVLLLAVDAWRLAAAHNARVDEQERDDAEASGA